MKRLLALLMALCLPMSALADVAEQVQAPERLTLLDPIVTNTGGTTIAIDAEIDVPRVEGMNVYPITPMTITPDMVYALCQELNMDKLCGVKKDGTRYPVSDINSPEDVTFTSSATSSYGLDYVYNEVDVQGNGYVAYIYNYTWRGKPYGSSIQLELRKRPFDYDSVLEPFLPEESMEGCAYSRAEAEEMAVRLASCIDPDLTIERKGIVMGTHWMTGWTEEELKAELERNKDIVIPNGYGFVFARMVDGVRVPGSQFQGIGGPEEHQMRPSFRNEVMSVTVCDQGIDTVHFYNGYDLGEPTQTNVELLPFDQIITTATALFPLKYMPKERNAYGGQFEYKYYIHRISLNYMRVLKENAPETFELIPVWDFWGTNEHRWYKDGAWSDWHSDGGDNYSYLTINAMNGLVVDREYSY